MELSCKPSEGNRVVLFHVVRFFEFLTNTPMYGACHQVGNLAEPKEFPRASAVAGKHANGLEPNLIN